MKTLLSLFLVLIAVIGSLEVTLATTFTSSSSSEVCKAMYCMFQNDADVPQNWWESIANYDLLTGTFGKKPRDRLQACIEKGCINKEKPQKTNEGYKGSAAEKLANKDWTSFYHFRGKPAKDTCRFIPVETTMFIKQCISSI